MTSHEPGYQDVVGGALLIAVGLFVAVYATLSYDLGTPRQMGPGMFPVLLGYVTAGCGVVLVISALLRAAPRVDVRIAWRPLIMIALSVAVFALSITSLGLLPAVMLMTLCAALAEGKLKLRGALLLGAVLAALAIMIFIVGLNIPVRVLRGVW
jgi:hypothetical protein